MDAKYQRRLELTWTNKNKRLLAQPDGTYEWVTPADYRVAEIRLLQPTETHGDNPNDNLLIQGDSPYALQSLKDMPPCKRNPTTDTPQKSRLEECMIYDR